MLKFFKKASKRKTLSVFIGFIALVTLLVLFLVLKNAGKLKFMAADTGSTNVITNVATVTYQDGDNVTYTVTSNPVTTTIGTAPVATLTANPRSISAGGSSTLTWSVTGMTDPAQFTCTAGPTGSNSWFNNTLSGSASVSPAATITYTLDCTDRVSGIASNQASETVTVSTVTNPVVNITYNFKVEERYTPPTTPPTAILSIVTKDADPNVAANVKFRQTINADSFGSAQNKALSGAGLPTSGTFDFYLQSASHVSAKVVATIAQSIDLTFNSMLGGDINVDFLIGAGDVGTLYGAWDNHTANSPADLDNSGVVDITDFNIYLGNPINFYN